MTNSSRKRKPFLTKQERKLKTSLKRYLAKIEKRYKQLLKIRDKVLDKNLSKVKTDKELGAYLIEMHSIYKLEQAFRPTLELLNKKEAEAKRQSNRKSSMRISRMTPEQLKQIIKIIKQLKFDSYKGVMLLRIIETYRLYAKHKNVKDMIADAINIYMRVYRNNEGKEMQDNDILGLGFY